MKTCAKCGVVKERVGFHQHKTAKDGIRYACKVCVAILRTAWRKANQDAVRAASAAYYATYYVGNTEKLKAAGRVYYTENRERCLSAMKVWRKANRVLCNANGAKWCAANPGKVNAANAKYRADKLQATPAWVSYERINCYYLVAAMLNREGLQRWHVDHIIPLKGKNVCGLHVENNLQILTEFDNCRKSNVHASD